MTTPFLRAAHERSTWSSSTSLYRPVRVRDEVRANLNCSPQSNRWGSVEAHSYKVKRDAFAQLGKSIGVAIASGNADLLKDALNSLQHRWSRDIVGHICSLWGKKYNEDLDHFECNHCGTSFLGLPYSTDYNDNDLCKSCASDYYVYSECMDAYIPSDASHSVYCSARSARQEDADDYCTREWGRRNLSVHEAVSGFLTDDAYSDFCDEYEEENGDDDDERCDDSLVAYYHEGRDIGHIPSPTYDKKRVWLGLELEIECGDRGRDDVARSINSNVNTDRKYVRFETDGSLSYGVELITGYTGLDVHEKWLKRFANANLDGCKSHDTSTCGLHVHIDKRGLTPFQAARLMLFINNPANEKLIRAVARRYGRDAGYAKLCNKSKSAIHAAHYAAKRRGGSLTWMNEDRYEALNFQPERTVEYRLYRGTLKVETIMACLEFTWLSYWFARETSISHLGTEDFIKFISDPKNKRESRYLRQLLAAKGLMPPPKAKPAPESPSPEVESDNPPAPRSRRGEEATVTA